MAQPIIPGLSLAGHLGLRSPDAPLFAHSARSTDPLDQIDRLADLGFEGVFDGFLKLRPPAEQSAIGRRRAERGLRMGSFNNDPQRWNQPVWNRADPESRACLRRTVEESSVLAERVGGGAAVCVTGLDPEQPRAEQVLRMIDNLRLVAPLAERAGLVLLVEAVADDWIPGLLVNSLADGLVIVRAVESPAVRLLFDTGHVRMMGEDVLPALEESWDVIGGIQVADVPGRVDLGAGELDWPAILGRIVERGHAGLVEVELLPQEDSVQGEARLVDRLRAIATAMKEGRA